MRTSRAIEPTARAIADAVRAERIARRLQQEQLARRADMTQSMISRLENAHLTPRLEVLSRVAAAMGLAVELRLVPIRRQRRPR